MFAESILEMGGRGEYRVDEKTCYFVLVIISRP